MKPVRLRAANILGMILNSNYNVYYNLITVWEFEGRKFILTDVLAGRD
jgi:hypothetical protein